MPFNIEQYERYLDTQFLGRTLHYRETTNSTMDDARLILENDKEAPPGFVCVAGEQLQGRGRLGRTWISAPGSGLYSTFYIKKKVGENAPLITIVAAIAVAEATRLTTGVELNFKWPNDVMYEGKKVSGILAEAYTDSGDLNILLGIGINREWSGNIPSEIANIAVSLSEIAGFAPNTEELLASLTNVLESKIFSITQFPESIIDEWSNKLTTIGKEITLNTINGSIDGQATGVTNTGDLILLMKNGEYRHISAGDVALR
ncbi:MAG: biotin--[acetyl-CoA-carboxylase] ligase [Chloroflexi bacterium]|nr:biotin--[acetyl-CoA-carboxylase] ligase [Chloroflexota bacterium]|tara:strand:- start:12515 stop:13294 length:780 start_codon:yes stop_codon:yes gene_type:complete